MPRTCNYTAYVVCNTEIVTRSERKNRLKSQEMNASHFVREDNCITVDTIATSGVLSPWKKIIRPSFVGVMNFLSKPRYRKALSANSAARRQVWVLQCKQERIWHQQKHIHAQQCSAFWKRQIVPSVLHPIFLIYLEYVVILHSGPFMVRCNTVGMATACRLGDRRVGFRVPVGQNIFTFPYRLDLLWGPIQWVPGALSRGVKRQGREADHSPVTSAEVKKTWTYTSTPPFVFMAYCWIN
jgi:hypothetical protein